MARELTTEDFIEKSNKVHGNKYDYSKSKYINNTTKVIIICLEHGEFEQTPHHHKRGGGCTKCANNKKSKNYSLNINEFLQKAKKTHEDKYDYSLVNYKNNSTKINIICSSHGIFKQTPGAHMLGQGCPKCNKGTVSISKVMKRINQTHGNIYKYDFSNYQGVNNKIIIKCKIHGEFEQRLSDHLNGCGCPICGGKLKLNTQKFIQKAIYIHKNRYDYSLTKYKNSKSKIKIICCKHGTFNQTPNSHLRGQGCPSCKLSKGEIKIEELLKENNIKFEGQYKFKKCKNKKELPFDFYLPEHNICIEFNGRQHYEPVDAFGGKESFKKIKINDKIKKEFCKNNKIQLLVIKYTDNIRNKLKILSSL